MTDGIDPTRPRRDTDFTHTDPPPVHKAVPQPLSYPADGPDASFGPLPRVRNDASVQRVADVAKTPLQNRLDAFLESATPTFMVDGHEVRVPIPFRMTVDIKKLGATNSWRDHEVRAVTPKQEELEAAAASVGLGDTRHLGLLRSGRATPQDVQKVTQALIDRGRLPSPDGKAADVWRVRQMMFDYGLGMDCAGYTQQAFLASRGERRAQTRLAPDIADEDLTHLEREGFRSVPIDHARPGDILVLDPPPYSEGQPGHTLVVYDRRDATRDELQALQNLPGFGEGHVTAYVVDSSFGSNATSEHGGVMRQIWWRNDANRNWARRDPEDTKELRLWSATAEAHASPSDRPYDGHVVHGLYRPTTEGL